jgi:hypothetical protein
MQVGQLMTTGHPNDESSLPLESYCFSFADFFDRIQCTHHETLLSFPCALTCKNSDIITCTFSAAPATFFDSALFQLTELARLFSYLALLF